MTFIKEYSRPIFEEGAEPRAWFVRRIREQAQQEGFAFTPFEESYLATTEAGDDNAASKMLESIKRDAFEEFDNRISGLAWRRYQADLVASPDADEQYARAMHALAKVDDYPNLGMFVSCIGLKTSPEELNAPGSSWPTVILIGSLILLGLLGWWKR